MKTPQLPYRIVEDRYEVFIGNREIRLSPKEYDIFKILHDSKKTMSREQLIENVWPNKCLSDTRTVDQHVARLRRKLRGINVVITVPNRGYKVALAQAAK